MGGTPNVLIIQTDQQSAWTLGAYGGQVVGTPHIDSIGREGATFSNFYTNSAVCTPSRGCFVTGRYPHAHGAYHNEMPLNGDEVTFAHRFADAGYETGYAGKWHLAGREAGRPGWLGKSGDSMRTLRGPARFGNLYAVPRFSFADCRWMFECSHQKGVIDDGDRYPQLSADPEVGRYMTDWLTDKTIEFLRRPRQAPFCFMVSIPDPHEPYTVREPYASLFSPEEVPIPATFDEPNPPDWAREDLEGCGSCHTRANPEAWLRQARAAYCGQVRCIDDNVGRLLDCLRERDLLDETVVVFTTDHGDYMGEHGLVGKNRVYEAAYRIPLLIRWPAAVAAGTVIEGFVTTVDFKPTILGLAGLPSDGTEQGRDASPLLRGEEVAWADEAFFHHSHFDFAGLFTPAYELALSRRFQHALFSRTDDPDQTRNLFTDPAHQDVIAALTARIIEHHRRVACPALDWLESSRCQVPGVRGQGQRPRTDM